MKKKIVYLFVILAFVSLIIGLDLARYFTGLSTNVSVGVGSVTRGAIYLNYPYIVQQHYTMNITMRLKNTGSAAFSQRMGLYVLNENASETLEDFYDGWESLLPGETRTAVIYYTPNTTGFHWLHANSSYGTSVTDAWGAFYVMGGAPPTTYIPSAPSVTRITPTEYGQANMSLEYDDGVNVSKGQKYIIPITVKNTGSGNKSLTDVMLLATVSGIPFDITPKRIERISVNRTGLFLVTLSVPYRIDVGSYDIEFKVISGVLEESGKITINVNELEIREIIRRMLENYRYIANRIRQQINDAMSDGINVSKAVEYLEIAENGIETAQRLYDIEDYERAMEELDTVRANLEMALFELAMATIPPMPLYLPAYVPYVLMVIIIGVIASVIHFWYFGKKRKEKAKKTEEEGESLTNKP